MNCSISGREQEGEIGTPKGAPTKPMYKRKYDGADRRDRDMIIERELMSGDELDLNTRKPVLLSTFRPKLPIPYLE